MGKARCVYFGPKAQKVLRQFMVGRAVDAPMFSPREGNAERKRRGAKSARRENQKPNPRKTDRTIGEQYDKDSYRKSIAAACRAADVPKWTPYQLRHAAASALRREFGEEAVADVLGNTLDVARLYGERAQKRAKQIIGRVG